MDPPWPLIAIVDDEESVRKALERLLRSMEIDARGFASGQEFLNALEDLHPDCVLLDLHMPGLSGFDVLRRLAALPTAVPVVVITGNDSLDAEQNVLKSGASAYLRKPVNERVLLDAIAAATGISTLGFDSK